VAVKPPLNSPRKRSKDPASAGFFQRRKSREGEEELPPWCCHIKAVPSYLCGKLLSLIKDLLRYITIT
jgi:hypothetical protein